MIPRVGVYSLIALALLIIVYPIILKLGHQVGYLRRVLQGFADRRLKLSTEMFQVRLVIFHRLG